MTEYLGDPPIVVANGPKEFHRLCAKYGLGTEAIWAKPLSALYGCRTPLIVISEAVWAAPPPRWNDWVGKSLMCRLACDGRYVEDGRADDARTNARDADQTQADPGPELDLPHVRAAVDGDHAGPLHDLS